MRRQTNATFSGQESGPRVRKSLASTARSSVDSLASPINSQATALRKELGLVDLILATILFVVVPDFFGTAVKAGPAHVALWLLGIALFFIPQALVVSHLN